MKTVYICKYYKTLLDKKGLKNNLKGFIEREEKYNALCSLSEEIDFQGLLEYIEVNLLNDVSNGIFKQNKKERETAKKYIIDRAVEYILFSRIIDRAVEFSKAETKEARQRVTRIIDISLNIIKDFYKREITC